MCVCVLRAAERMMSMIMEDEDIERMKERRRKVEAARRHQREREMQ